MKSKVLVSILLGLAGFMGAFYSLSFSNSPFSITLTWSYCFPLLAGMAYGGRYGLIAGILGLGGLFPFFLWPANGWANLVASGVYIAWYGGQGYFESLRRKKPAWWNHPLVSGAFCAACYAVSVMILYPLAFSFNPPVWALAAPREMPVSVLEGIVVKGAILLYIAVMLDTCLLQIHQVRTWFHLEVKPESRQNGRMFWMAVASSFVLWGLLILFDRIFLDQTFPNKIFPINDPHEVIVLIVFGVAGLMLGLILMRYVESRLKAEARFSESESRFRALFEQAPDAILLFDSLENRFVDANQSAERLFGCPRAELLTHKPQDFYPPGQPDGRPVEESVLANNRLALAGQELVFERKVRSLEGRECRCEVRLTAFPSRQGLMTRASFIDISERKQAEEALRVSEQKYRTLVNEASDAILMLDEDIFVECNAKAVELYGCDSKADLLSHKPTDFSPPSQPDGRDSREAAWEYIQAARNGAPQRFYWKHCRKDGSLLDMEVSLNSHSVDGKIYLLAIVRDISERTQAEEKIRKLNVELEDRVRERTAQLQATNQELEAFAYSVSHDLRAPLRAIDGFACILLEDNPPEDERSRLLSKIAAQVTRMDRLITAILALSRVSRADLVVSRVDMGGLVRSVYAEIASPEVQSGYTCWVQPLPEAQGDPILIRQVWANLISNAIKYTAPQPERRIEIGGYTQAGMNVYYVKDNGVGFDPDYAHKLFGVFQRLHSPNEFEGTGIGLAMVKRIIVRHGGQIWAKGQIDQGATFYFSLPIGPSQ